MTLQQKHKPLASKTNATRLFQALWLILLASLTVGCSQFNTSSSLLSYNDLNYCPFPAIEALNQKNSTTAGALINELFSRDKSELSTKINHIESPTISLEDDGDIWPHLRHHFALDLSINNQKVQAQRDWYGKHQNYMDRVLSRATPYLFYIVEEIKKRDLPMELALLPIVESAYDPFAYSHGRASGIWQFIPTTGQRFGLKQNWWYDGRRDIVASTRAALDYMEYLNKRFNGNWLHALAAYNSGEGTVLKAIRKNKQLNRATDFWSLELPKETRDYVPKLIAIAQLINTPDDFNISLLPIENRPYFEEVTLSGQIDLAQAAELAALDLNTVYTLNPGFNRWATDPDGPHRLLIPLQQAAQFQQALTQLPPGQQVSWQRYTIKSGDSLSEIASKHHITSSLLKQINHLSSDNIRAGKTLLIPSSAKNLDQYQLTSRQRLLTKQQKQVSGKNKINHQVKSGDSFWSLSKKYDVSVSSLARWNNMAPKDPLKIGQNLAVWTKTSQAGNSGPQVIRKVHYKVRQGDSLSGIASKFNVKVAQLSQWNDLEKKKYLQPGQSLTLFVDVTKLTL